MPSTTPTHSTNPGPWRAFAQTINILALSIWLGTIVISGVFAARIFVIMRELQPRLEPYSAYTGEHWKLAGGKVANEIFFIGDIIQFSCAFLAALSFGTLIIQRALSPRRISTWLRGLGLSVAMSSVAGLIILVNPQLNAALQMYWTAALKGDNDNALKYQQIAADIHPFASTLMSIAAVSVLISLIAGVWSIARHAPQSAIGVSNSSSPYPEPALLRRKKGW